MTLMDLLLGLVVLVLILTAYLIYLSRHKKSATGAINLVGATGIVQSTLDPEGSVIINGELWRARAVNGPVGDQQRVRVVGVDSHLVLVESWSDKL